MSDVQGGQLYIYIYHFIDVWAEQLHSEAHGNFAHDQEGKQVEDKLPSSGPVVSSNHTQS